MRLFQYLWNSLMDFIKDKGKIFQNRSKSDYHVHSLKYKHAPQMCHSSLILYHIPAIKMPLDST